MTNREIFRIATEAADSATEAKFDGLKPSTCNAAGDYWKLVFDAVAENLNRTVNGVF